MSTGATGEAVSLMEAWSRSLDMLCAERLQLRLETMVPYSDRWERYQVLDRMIEAHLDSRPSGVS